MWKGFTEAYGPDGLMSHGDLLVWVGLAMNGRDMDVEYIGGCDTTGFLAYDGFEGFFAYDGFEGFESEIDSRRRDSPVEQ